MKRRKVLKGLLGVSAASLVAGLYAWQIEPFWLEFVKKKMPLAHLPEHLVGKTLMQISDMHVGNRFDRSFISDSFKEAQVLQPDVVVYTGDFVSYESEEQITQLREVMQYAVKGKRATVAILGNHDYGENWSEAAVAQSISSVLKAQDITVLRNESCVVDELHIIGLDDYWGLNFNPNEVMAKVDHTQCNLVLCHNPDVCDLDVWNGYKSWILSGHTHGGQVKPPFLDPLILPVKNKRYTSGEIPLEDGRTLYINRALGHLRQVRFNARPEITVFELEKKVG